MHTEEEIKTANKHKKLNLTHKEIILKEDIVALTGLTKNFKFSKDTKLPRG